MTSDPIKEMELGEQNPKNSCVTLEFYSEVTFQEMWFLTLNISPNPCNKKLNYILTAFINIFLFHILNVSPHIECFDYFTYCTIFHIFLKPPIILSHFKLI